MTVIARLQGAVRQFGAVRALDGLDLEVREGELLALLGPNGAGKTTAIHVLLGLLRLDAGHAELLGRPIVSGGGSACGAMFQQAALPDMLSARELLEFARCAARQPRSLAQCIELGGLEQLVDRRYGQLSGGEQRRVQLALALATRPRLVFLDEPSNAMDRAARQRLYRTLDEIRAEGTSILLTTHVLEEVEERASRLLLIRNGKAVLEGRPAEIRGRLGLRQIEARTRLDDAELAACGSFEQLERDGTRIRLRSRDAEALVRQLLARDPGLSELGVHALKLDEVLGHYEAESA